MTVLSCTLSRTGRGGRYFVDANGGVSGEMIVEWKVVTNSVTDGWNRVYTGALTSTPDPLPAFYDTYNVNGDIDSDLFFMSTDPTQNEDKLTHWTIRGTYKNLQFGLTGSDATANPLERPWKAKLEFDTISEVVTEGQNVDSFTPLGGAARPAGTTGPITNTAGDEFGTVNEQSRTRIIYVASKNFASLDDMYAIAIANADSLNQTKFATYDPEHCEFLGITTSDLLRESGVEYYRGTVRIALNQKIQHLNAINNGFKAWVSGTTQKVIREDGTTGLMITDPAILNANGTHGTADGSPRQEVVSYRTRLKLVNYNSIFA